MFDFNYNRIYTYCVVDQMNILPQKYSDFKDKDYWNSFYSSLKNTDNQHFQWYGNYEDFKYIFHPEQTSKFIQPKQTILHVGCGKSTFGEDLYKAFKAYEACELDITNCDYSEQMIQAMKQRLDELQDPQLTKMEKKNIKYQVCDLLTDFMKKDQYKHYLQNFQTIIDKGTLDAMLPEDKQDNVYKIKQNYFQNMELCLRKEGGKFVIISMLQSFILRTIIEYFYEKNQKRLNNYTITIYECLIRDSTMQPFLIKIQKCENSPQFMNFKRLGTEELEKLSTKQQIMHLISEIQQRNEYAHKIKSLIPGQRTKYKIFNKDKKNTLRYLVEVVDSQDKSSLQKNNCAVFIVPQGSENAYHFDDSTGIRQLQEQVGASRLLLAKLMPDNTFKSIEEVKGQLNSVVPNLIQKGCQPDKVPYMMNAEELGHKNALFKNKQMILDEVFVGGEPYRRFFKKSNLSFVQSEFKLCYNGTNHIYVEYSKKSNSNTLPPKKNMIVGIDKQQLADGHSQRVYAGIAGFLGQNRLRKQKCKVLIIGEQIALAKYLVDSSQAVEVTLLTNLNSLKQNAFYFQIIESQQLEIIKVKDSFNQYFAKYPESKFDVVVYFSNDLQGIPMPSIDFFEGAIDLIKNHISELGLFVCHYWNYQGTKNRTLLFKTIASYFFPIYGQILAEEKDDNNIIFCLQYPLEQRQGKMVVHEQLIKNKLGNSKNLRNGWMKEKFEGLKVVWPDIMEKGNVIIEKDSKFQDIYVPSSSKPKKNKKKK